MYWVQWFCPRQSPHWQTSERPYGEFATAVAWCHSVKPPGGAARVLDQHGQVIYEA